MNAADVAAWVGGLCLETGLEAPDDNLNVVLPSLPSTSKQGNKLTTNPLLSNNTIHYQINCVSNELSALETTNPIKKLNNREDIIIQESQLLPSLSFETLLKSSGPNHSSVSLSNSQRLRNFSNVPNFVQPAFPNSMLSSNEPWDTINGNNLSLDSIRLSTPLDNSTGNTSSRNVTAHNPSGFEGELTPCDTDSGSSSSFNATGDNNISNGNEPNYNGAFSECRPNLSTKSDLPSPTLSLNSLRPSQFRPPSVNRLESRSPILSPPIDVRHSNSVTVPRLQIPGERCSTPLSQSYSNSQVNVAPATFSSISSPGPLQTPMSLRRTPLNISRPLTSSVGQSFPIGAPNNLSTSWGSNPNQIVSTSKASSSAPPLGVSPILLRPSTLSPTSCLQSIDPIPEDVSIIPCVSNLSTEIALSSKSILASSTPFPPPAQFAGASSIPQLSLKSDSSPIEFPTGLTSSTMQPQPPSSPPPVSHTEKALTSPFRPSSRYSLSTASAPSLSAANGSASHHTSNANAFGFQNKSSDILLQNHSSDGTLTVSSHISITNHVNASNKPNPAHRTTHETAANDGPLLKDLNCGSFSQVKSAFASVIDVVPTTALNVISSGNGADATDDPSTTPLSSSENSQENSQEFPTDVFSVFSRSFSEAAPVRYPSSSNVVINNSTIYDASTVKSASHLSGDISAALEDLSFDAVIASAGPFLDRPSNGSNRNSLGGVGIAGKLSVMGRRKEGNLSTECIDPEKVEGHSFALPRKIQSRSGESTREFVTAPSFGNHSFGGSISNGNDDGDNYSEKYSNPGFNMGLGRGGGGGETGGGGIGGGGIGGGGIGGGGIGTKGRFEMVGGGGVSKSSASFTFGAGERPSLLDLLNAAPSPAYKEATSVRPSERGFNANSSTYGGIGDQSTSRSGRLDDGNDDMTNTVTLRATFNNGSITPISPPVSRSGSSRRHLLDSLTFSSPIAVVNNDLSAHNTRNRPMDLLNPSSSVLFPRLQVKQ